MRLSQRSSMIVFLFQAESKEFMHAYTVKHFGDHYYTSSHVKLGIIGVFIRNELLLFLIMHTHIGQLIKKYNFP